MKKQIEFKNRAESHISFLETTKAEHFKQIIELKTDYAKNTRRIKALELSLLQRDKRIKRLKEQLNVELGMIADDVDDFEEVCVTTYVNVHMCTMIWFLEK